MVNSGEGKAGHIVEGDPVLTGAIQAILMSLQFDHCRTVVKLQPGEHEIINGDTLGSYQTGDHSHRETHRRNRRRQPRGLWHTTNRATHSCGQAQHKDFRL